MNVVTREEKKFLINKVVGEKMSFIVSAFATVSVQLCSESTLDRFKEQ